MADTSYKVPDRDSILSGLSQFTTPEAAPAQHIAEMTSQQNTPPESPKDQTAETAVEKEPVLPVAPPRVSEDPPDNDAPRISSDLRKIAELKKHAESKARQEREAIAKERERFEKEREELVQKMRQELTAEMRARIIKDAKGFSEEMGMRPLDLAKIIAQPDLPEDKRDPLVADKARVAQELTKQRSEYESLREEIAKMKSEMASRQQEQLLMAKAQEVKTQYRDFLTNVPEHLTLVRKLAENDPDKLSQRLLEIGAKYEYQDDEPFLDPLRVAEYYQEVLERDFAPLLSGGQQEKPTKSAKKELKNNGSVPISVTTMAGRTQPTAQPKTNEEKDRAVLEGLIAGLHLK